jgi:DNA-binding response OmpR family regulator
MSRNASEKILIVEDEQHLADGLRFNLEAEGYQVRAVDTGEAALELLLPASGNGAPAAAKHAFDVVVLDVMLPGKDGFAVISELRQAGHFVPTIILTARGRPEDVLEGFAAGADDYLPKPFELAILIARIRGLLRRREWLQASAAPPEPKDSFVFGDKSIHFDLLELRVRGQVYPLTVMEASVLRYLVEHEDKAVSRKAMLQDVWGLHEDTDTRAIDNFIVRLRRYLEDDATRPRHLLTVRGVGYRFIAFPAV